MHQIKEHSRNGKWPHLPKESVHSVYGERSGVERILFRVKEWRRDGWRKWKRKRRVEISMKRWKWFTKWSRKLDSEVRRSMLKGTMTTSEESGIFSLNRDEIVQIGCENFVRQVTLYCMHSSTLSEHILLFGEYCCLWVHYWVKSCMIFADI